ncbi:MAG: hypothetical protein ACK5T0_01820 [Vampirovibrionales bacterium]
MRLASPSLNSPSLTLPQNQRSGGFGVKQLVTGLATVVVATGLNGCDGASKKVGDTLSSFRNSLPVLNGYGNGAKFLKNVQNKVTKPLIDAGVLSSEKPNPIILNPKEWLKETAKRNNCAGTEAVLATQQPFLEVIAASETSQRKVSNQGVINSPIFKALDFRTPEKKVEEALVRNPLAQQTIQDFRQEHDTSFNRALLAMNFPGARQRMAKEIVRAGLVPQAKAYLDKMGDQALAEQGREALKAAQPTASAMPAVPSSGWGQNVLALEDRAIMSLTNNPNGSNSTIIQKALRQFRNVNEEAGKGNIIAQTFREEINTALGPAEISNQTALFIGQNIPYKDVQTMTLEEQLTELGNLNQHVFGAGVTPETEELLNPPTPQ